MNVLLAVKNYIVRSFKYPKPYNWGYPVFFGAVGYGLAFLLLKLMFSGAFPFSSTSLIGCAVIVIVLEMAAFIAPSVLLAEKGGLNITGQYTGIGALILSFLSGAPIYLIKASLHNLSVAMWLNMGGTIVFPAFFYLLEDINGQSLALGILIDTVIPAFGLSLFFMGAVWQGFSARNKRLGFFLVPLLIGLFSLNFLDIIAIVIIGWWLCIVRNHTENIYGPVLALLGSRFTGILIEGIVGELDITTIRVYSDIPSTIYYSTVPALVVAVILLAFFRKTLGEFHFAYSADIYGDTQFPEVKDGGKAGGFFKGINLTIVLGIAIMAVLWILLFEGVRI
ncbi:MAG: hypothetical protein K5875_01820 [Saccharofermentans sp.]|nr:hypothetical protein [Saccharofermentans sp.]